MTVLLWILVYLTAFCMMEFMAWFTHKYIMHGFLWSLHKDHHLKDHESWWERNDAFFLFYAAVSIGCLIAWQYYGFWAGMPIGLGIFSYGVTYFLVHDIFIHQRFKMFRNANNWYAKGIRRAHKIHHKQLSQKDSQCFGMLLPPLKYFKTKK